MIKKLVGFVFLLLVSLGLVIAQSNPKHVQVNGYYKDNGTYVQPYFRTAPNSTNRDNFSTKGNVNPYTNKPGWIEPDSKYNTFYYSTYSYSNPSNNLDTCSDLRSKHKDRAYIEDERGNFTCYLTVLDERTFCIFDMKEKLILYLVINHRLDWRLFDPNWIYIKTIFITTEK
jgi:hypothetical protein